MLPPSVWKWNIYHMYMLQWMCQISECVYFLKFSGNIHIPWFTQGLYIFPDIFREFTHSLKNTAHFWHIPWKCYFKCVCIVACNRRLLRLNCNICSKIKVTVAVMDFVFLSATRLSLLHHRLSATTLPQAVVCAAAVSKTCWLRLQYIVWLFKPPSNCPGIAGHHKIWQCVCAL